MDFERLWLGTMILSSLLVPSLSIGGEIHHLVRNAHVEGYVEQLERLITNGADLNEKTYNGWAALHITADYGSEDAVNLLIAHGADVNVTSDAGATPLHMAALMGGDRGRYAG